MFARLLVIETGRVVRRRNSTGRSRTVTSQRRNLLTSDEVPRCAVVDHDRHRSALAFAPRTPLFLRQPLEESNHRTAAGEGPEYDHLLRSVE